LPDERGDLGAQLVGGLSCRTGREFRHDAIAVRCIVDLAQAQRAGTSSPASQPRARPRWSSAIVQAPARLPAQPCARLGDVQLEELRFVRMLAAIEPPARTVAPLPHSCSTIHCTGARVVVARAEVPAFGERGAIRPQALRQHQVAG
jgi:hypothetical protein